MPDDDPAKPILASRIPIIEYHDSEYKGGATVQMKTEWFLEQMNWLSANGFRSLSGEELIQFAYGAVQPPQKSFALRFDLGLPVLANFRDVIVPALIQYAFHASFFVLTKMIKDTSQKNSITWEQLKDWEQTGLIEIGSHGVNHPNYRKITAAALRKDAKASKSTIEAMLGHPISFLAYSYDSIPDLPERFLKPLGYRLAIGGYRRERSVVFHDPTPYELPSYYPYCSPKTYPVITGARGLTFGQLIEKAVAVL